MSNLDLFWKSNKDWWHYEEDPDDDEHLFIIFHDDAPLEAQISYRHYLQQKADFEKNNPNCV